MTQLFDNSGLSDLSLKNLALFPSSYRASVSSGSLNWANLNFQEFGQINERVWELNGSGANNENYVFITYIIDTGYDIHFSGSISGWLTTDSLTYALNSTNSEITYKNEQNTTILTISLSCLNSLGNYSYHLLFKDFTILPVSVQYTIYDATGFPEQNRPYNVKTINGLALSGGGSTIYSADIGLFIRPFCKI